MLRERAKPGDPYGFNEYFKYNFTPENTFTFCERDYKGLDNFITTQQNNNSAHFFNFTCKPKEVIRHNTYLNKEIISLPKPSLISGTDINVPEIKQNHEIIWGKSIKIDPGFNLPSQELEDLVDENSFKIYDMAGLPFNLSYTLVGMQQYGDKNKQCFIFRLKIGTKGERVEGKFVVGANNKVEHMEARHIFIK